MRAVAAKWLHGKGRWFDALASIKAWAGLVGMSGGPVRPPLLPHTAAERDELAADLAAVGLRPGTGRSRRVSSNGHHPTLTDGASSSVRRACSCLTAAQPLSPGGS